MEKVKAALARHCATSGLTSLSQRLAKHFSGDNGEGGAGRNVVFSPLSIHSALSLVAVSAEGKTLSELLGLLGARSRKELEADVRGMVSLAFPEAQKQEGGGPHVSYACGVWHDSKRAVKPSYRDLAVASFRAAVRAVDFRTKPEEARKKINSWVAEATNNLIDSIMGPGSVDKSTRLVITNAIYFKGSWAKPFDKSMTEEDKFHRLDGSVVDAQFMSSDSDQYIGVHNGFKVLRMPYATPPNLFGTAVAMEVGIPRTVPPRYSMCIFLPDKRDGLHRLQDKMASSPRFLQDHMPRAQVEVGDFRVPKFKLSFDISLKKALEDLGVKAAFSAGAELPGMLQDDRSKEPLFVGDVLHKAVIEVNEEGTEAAAVTATGRAMSSQYQPPPPPPTHFVAEHPFAFFVVEEVSGAILFAGHVVDPTRP